MVHCHGPATLKRRIAGTLLETTPQEMASTPNSSFPSLSSNDPLDEFLFAQGTGLSDPGVLERRRMLELVKRLR